MTREETKKCIEVMQAYVDGTEVETRGDSIGNHLWYVEEDPAWKWSFCLYRIKEEPKPCPLCGLKKDCVHTLEDREKAFKTFSWRGKNIQWVADKYQHAPVYRVIAMSVDGFVKSTALNEDHSIFVKWEHASFDYEWSSDNATWRKFE